MRIRIPPRRYANQNALATSICEPSSGSDEVRFDALMEENDVWVTFPFQGPVIDSETTADSNLQMAGLVEMQREKTSVGESTFLVKRECSLLGLAVTRHSVKFMTILLFSCF